MRKPQPLKLRLVERDISQRSLARVVGCSEQWLGEVANGYAQPSAELAAAIAEALGEPVEDLFRAEGPEAPRRRRRFAGDTEILRGAS